MALIKFEKKPDFMQCVGGKTTLTNEQYKCGKSALCWEYNSGDKIVFRTPIGYIFEKKSPHDNRENIFALYLYGTGNEGVLNVGFLCGEDVCANFNIDMGFVGWRHIAVSFDRDMCGNPKDNMDGFFITAKGNGCVLLDEIITCARVDYRHIIASPQLPHIANKLAPLRADWKLKSRFKPKNIDEDEIKIIAHRYRQYVLNEYDCDKTDEELIRESDDLEIRKGRYGYVGKRVEHRIQRTYLADIDGKKDEYKDLRTVTDLMCHLAVRYGKYGNKILLKKYICLLEYIINQGVAYGSTMGGHSILDYSLRPLYFSLVVMVDEPELYLLREELFSALKWFTHLGKRGFCEGETFEYSTTDDFFNLAPGIMALSLMITDIEEKAWYLKTLSGWLEFNMTYTDGLTDMFKEDGCIYHHAGHYPAYGNGALTGITPILYALGGTQYDIDKSARDNIRHIMLTMRFQSVGRMFPTAFSGRHPFLNNGIDILPYRYFAKYELLHGKVEMAEVYLRLSKGKVTAADNDILESGAKPEKICEGNISYPMACANVHRRDNWMVVTKGYSKYLWGSESYIGDNLYGRYRSYGVTELYNDVENAEKRYDEDGYDWSRFSGATAIHIPLEQLKAKIYNLDRFSGFEEMLISDQSFAGALSLKENGMFSMILTEHPKYNGKFCAYKSVFTKDDFILCIGSNINCESEYEVETTLFQNRILDGDNSIFRNGNKIYDNLGNIYYVDENVKVDMYEGTQHSLSAENNKPTSGDFAVAVISHGKNPENQLYVYSIGINGATMPDYEIIRQDEYAHIVRIGNITYFSIFRDGDYGRISTNIPLLAMIEECNGKTSMSFCNPDLGLYERDDDQYDELGQRREVSIYSRKWLSKRIGGKKASIEVDGRKLSFYMRGGEIITID